MVRVLIAGVWLLCLPINIALGCLIPEFEFHHFPSCSIQLPTENEKVTVIYDDSSAAFSDHHIGRPDQKTRLVTIQVKPNADQNYIVLSASQQTIWKFTGNIDSVDKVLALGSEEFGASVAGVIGIPADRIVFTKPDLTSLNDIGLTSCTRIYNACSPSQWFGGYKRSQSTTFHPPSSQSRQSVDAVISSRKGLSLGRSQFITIMPPLEENSLIEINPDTVVTSGSVRPYKILPGQAGIDALVDQKVLLPSSHPDAQKIIAQYAEQFSARYRSRFDPDYLMTPPINFVVTQDISLPPDLPDTILLIPKGVASPEITGNNKYSVCVFLEEDAGYPVVGDFFDSPFCRVQGAIPYEKDRYLLRAAAAFDEAPLAGKDCQITTLPPNAHIAVLALSEGEHRRYRDDPSRQINVAVTRTEPTVLYVAMKGGVVNWNVTGPNITAIYGRGGGGAGLNIARVNGQPTPVLALGNPKEGCPMFAPLDPSDLGPAIKHLDGMVLSLLGQDIDQVITFEETGLEWKAQNAPLPEYTIK